MTPQVPSDAFNTFFGWAPWIIGIAIYLVFYLAKRRECATPATAPSSGETYACANCGRRGSINAMVAQNHGAAVSYVCANCATH
jgi:DNA-directed RNA polymerase subunit RPC12/RpoP